MSAAQRWVITAALSVGLLAGQLDAQGRGRGQAKKDSAAGHAPAKNDHGPDTGVAVSVVFRSGDRAAFHDYFTTHRITAQALPPGIAKNVARGKPLPPGIAKRALPADLLAAGPRVGNDVSFSIVGRAVVALKNGVVIDILADIL